MHRSRLTTAYFDVPDAAFGAETAFWSGALGLGEGSREDPEYVELLPLVNNLLLSVQRIGDATPARIHFDIETDDMDAEVARLERLGATRVEFISHWWVLRDPAGMLFCVVRVQSPELFEALATTWED